MTIFEQNPEFEALLGYIKRNRGFDFTGYKRSTLMRRVQKRMQVNEIETYSNYMDFLEVHPEEFVHLFNTILINVTSFFRDRLNWEYLSSEIIPQITACKEPDEAIRIWSAGCASGQEAYTLAIIFSEALGVEKLREQVKIYATELDEEALNQARQGTYSVKEAEDVPEDLLNRYFERFEQSYTFRRDLRRSVIFGRHNLVTDAPISRIDLLTCRNTLMYFNAETQAKIISRFHFALNEGGFLFLGKAEMLLTQSYSFAPVDLKRRVFSKLPKTDTRDHLLLSSQNDDDQDNYLASDMRLRETAFDASPVAQIVVNLDGLLTLANERARTLFELRSRDLGRPLQDLEISYRPVELRSCIEQAYAERTPVNVRNVEWSTPNSDTQYFNVQISSLLDINSSLLGASITFTDVSRAKRLQDELEHSNREVEMAYEELQSTNEELETTNEELQSSNEELETTNEELQATNEELETMNEELQSSNEELQTINEELRQRSDELNDANDFLESIFTGLRHGVVVMNQELHILVWNNKTTDLWGLRADEVLGQRFLSLNIGIPVEKLRQPIRACLQRESQYFEVTLAAINRLGKSIQCKVICTPLLNKKEVEGVVLLMEEQESP